MTEQNAVNNHKETALAQYGSRNEIRELANRIRLMLPGGQKYTDAEALTLAQISIAHDLDPFNGECWLIKDEKNGRVYGALIGIKGQRKHAKRQSNYWGQSGNGGFTRITDPKRLEEYGAATDDVCFEYRISDEATLNSYAGVLERFTRLGFPLETAQKMAGALPVTIGVGIWKRGEQTKMKPAQCAMFRAEKDALKRRFDVHLRMELPGQSLPLLAAEEEQELSVEAAEAEYSEKLEHDGKAEEPHRDPDEIMAELGFDPGAPVEGSQPAKPEIMYDDIVTAGDYLNAVTKPPWGWKSDHARKVLAENGDNILKAMDIARASIAEQKPE